MSSETLGQVYKLFKTYSQNVLTIGHWNRFYFLCTHDFDKKEKVGRAADALYRRKDFCVCYLWRVSHIHCDEEESATGNVVRA